MKICNHPFIAAAMTTGLLAPGLHAAVSPYTADANTVYLYHLDEAAASTVAASTGTSTFSAIAFDGNPALNHATNPQPTVGTVLGAAAFAGFGTSANVSAADLGLGVDANASGGFQMGLNDAASPDAVLHSSFAGADGSFTIEAMVNVPAITGASREIVCTDNSLAATARGFQFRINTGGTLEFNFIGTNTATSAVAIPTTGGNAFVANEWFHVALSFNGPTNTSTFYWTRVVPTTLVANAIGTSVNETTLGTISGPLVIGNEARSSGGGVNSNEGLIGRIDEVRISNVARPDTGFIFSGSLADTDGDNLPDFWELDNFRATPEETEAQILAKYTGTSDPDLDLHDNFTEYTDVTNPNNVFSSADSEPDGLPDGYEVFWFREAPEEDLFALTSKYTGIDDPDSDGFSNAAEFAAATVANPGGTNPNNAAFTPIDTDGDGLVDSWEQFHFGDLDETAGSQASDADSATNLQEQNAGSNPTLTASTPSDTDGDGTPDASEAFQPYAADADTLHLWHLNDIKAPASDAGSGSLPLASLANGALMWTPSLPAFGTGLNPAAGRGTTTGGVLSALPLADGIADDTTLTYAGVDGAFTFEAIVRIDFNPAVAPASVLPMQIISGESDAGPNRAWQFRLVPIGATGNVGGTSPLLEFINLNGEVAVQALSVPLPTGADPDAIAQNSWYHVAVAYNGSEATAGNLKLYWTLLDPSRTLANEVLSGQLANDLPTVTPDFTIGNEGRSTSGADGNFVGVIDEVRISSVARAPFQFLFTSGDNDALDDSWEQLYFGGLGETPEGDFDHDGTDNLTEFRLGLIPNSGSSRFAATRSESGALQWPGVSGVSFKIERSGNLALWETLQAAYPGTAGTTSYTDPSPLAGKGFYKVTLNP